MTTWLMMWDCVTQSINKFVHLERWGSRSGPHPMGGVPKGGRADGTMNWSMSGITER